MTQRRTYRFARGTVLGLALGGALATAALYEHPVPDTGDFYGRLVETDQRNVVLPLDVRTGCSISTFGVAPWRPQGVPRDILWQQVTRRALERMSLPPEAIDEAIVKLVAGRADDTIGMGNTHGVASTSGAYFLPAYTTTYRASERYVVCHGSSTRFANSTRREFATVHRIQHAGTTYWIGEFLACGNVTRFLPAPPGWVPPAAQPHGAPVPPDSGSGPGAQVNNVPEPGSLALIALAAAGFIATRRKAK